METRCVQTQYCHPLALQCQRTASERSVPSPHTLGATDGPILPDSAYLQEQGKHRWPPTCLCFLFLWSHVSLSPRLQNWIDAPVSHSQGPVPAKIQGKAHDSPISLFLLWKWVSARGDGARSVPGRGSAAAASDSAVLVQVGSELQRWGAWCGWSCNRNGVGLFLKFSYMTIFRVQRGRNAVPRSTGSYNI